jgi:hypothetical protein
LPELKSHNIVTGWPTWIRELCDAEEEKELKIASQAAALACIGRGIYAALVQTLRKEDGAPSGEFDHCKHLDQVIHKFGAAARVLEIDHLKNILLAEPLPPSIITVLTKTKAWLQGGRPNGFMALRNVYCSAETPRKWAQSRLPATARKRRLQWDPDRFSRAVPLHYRLAVVHQLIRDLRK